MFFMCTGLHAYPMSFVSKPCNVTTNFIAHPAWEDWLGNISADLPCGPDLEYDPSFASLEQAVNGRPDVEYGQTVVAAVPPDWIAADALCLELLSRTRDLRVVVYLTRSRLVSHGVAGLADGLALIAGLLESQWRDVHPQLDASDADDPTARINALASLADPTGLLCDFLDTPIVPSMPAQTTALTLRQWTYATGEVVAPAQHTTMSVAEIEAALAAAVVRVVSFRAALDAALAHASRIEALVTGHVGTARTIDLGALTALLRRAQFLIATSLSKLDVVDAHNTVDAQVDGTPAFPSRAEVDAKAAPGNQVATRADVVATLDRVCDYYARHEPSSPVPLLLKRARGLVDKSFVDLLGELAPEGLAQLTQVIGTTGMTPSPD
jgi:type VI secretion system protein ImpA